MNSTTSGAGRQAHLPGEPSVRLTGKVNLARRFSVRPEPDGSARARVSEPVSGASAGKAFLRVLTSVLRPGRPTGREGRERTLASRVLRPQVLRPQVLRPQVLRPQVLRPGSPSAGSPSAGSPSAGSPSGFSVRRFSVRRFSVRVLRPDGAGRKKPGEPSFRLTGFSVRTEPD